MTFLLERRSYNLNMKSEILRRAYELLYEHFGPQGWWPAETPFEVCVGAILTQGTSWKNVESTIKNLKARDLLNPFALAKISNEELARLLKPCGYYNVKAKRLKNFLKFLIDNYHGDLEALKKEELTEIRKKLLSISGLGKETVDSILLYALDYPIFVVDAYTYRIMSRHHLLPEETTYEEMQELFMANLPEDIELFKEYHALLVACGKNYCKLKNPQCSKCPLKEIENV